MAFQLVEAAFGTRGLFLSLFPSPSPVPFLGANRSKIGCDDRDGRDQAVVAMTRHVHLEVVVRETEGVGCGDDGVQRGGDVVQDGGGGDA